MSPRDATPFVDGLYKNAGLQDPEQRAVYIRALVNKSMTPEQVKQDFERSVTAKKEDLATKQAAATKAVGDTSGGKKYTLREISGVIGRWRERSGTADAEMDKWYRDQLTSGRMTIEQAEKAFVANLTPQQRIQFESTPQELPKTSFTKLIAPAVIPVVAIVAPQVIPMIGSSLAPTASAVVQAGLGSAAVNSGVTAAMGGTGKDILKAGAAGFAGGAAGQLAGQAVQGAQGAGSLPAAGTTAGRVTEAAAKGAAGTGASTLVRTGDVKEALKQGALGGVASGAGEFASTQAQNVLPKDVGRTTQALVAGATGGATEAAIQRQDPLMGAITSAGLTAGATSLADKKAAADLAKQRGEISDAAYRQLIAEFDKGVTPGVGAEVGVPTAATSGKTSAALPGYTVTEYEPGTVFSPSGREVAGRFDPTEVTGKESGAPTIQRTQQDILDQILSESPTTAVPTGRPSTSPTTVAGSSIISPVSSVIAPIPPITSTAPTAAAPSVIPAKDRPIMDVAGITPTSPVSTPTTTTGTAALPPGTSTPIKPTTTEIGAAPSVSGGMAGGTTAGTTIGTVGGTGTLSDRDRQMLDLTGIGTAPSAPSAQEPVSRLPEVEVTGTPEEEPVGRLPTVEVTGEEEPITKQPSKIDRQLINYLYGNLGFPVGLQQGGMAPGSSALAQALSVGDPGALYLGKKGKERKPVWNVESLKLTDELGGAYG